MNILGISAYYHDSAACLVRDGEVLGAAQEERFSRKKHDADFPKHAVQFCLGEAGVRLEQLDYVAFYDKPFIKFERLLETYIANAPKGFRSFLSAMPVWLKEKLYLKRVKITFYKLIMSVVFFLCLCLCLCFFFFFVFVFVVVVFIFFFFFFLFFF